MTLKPAWFNGLLSLFVILFSAGIAFGQSITVETLNHKAKIYLDGQYVATELLYAFPVLEGLHLVSIMVDNQPIFSQSYALRFPQNLVVQLATSGSANTTVVMNPKDVPFPKRAVLNTADIFESTSAIAPGIHYSETLHGVSLRYWPSLAYGLELVGWSGISTNRYKETLGARFMLPVLQLAVQNRLARYYWGAGFGNQWVAQPAHTKRVNMKELFLGAELPSGHWGVMTYSFEVAYEWVSELGASDRAHFRLNVGSHFYF